MNKRGTADGRSILNDVTVRVDERRAANERCAVHLPLFCSSLASFTVVSLFCSSLASFTVVSLFCLNTGFRHAWIPDDISWHAFPLAFLFFFIFYLGFVLFYKERFSGSAQMGLSASTRKKFSVSALCAAVLFSSFHTLGSLIGADMDSLEPVSLAVMFARFAGVLPFWYMLITMIFDGLDNGHNTVDGLDNVHDTVGGLDNRRSSVGRPDNRHNSAERLDNRRSSVKLLNNRLRITLALFLLFCLCWAPTVIRCWPGSLAADTARSIASGKDASVGQNNPWFLNLLYSGTIQLGDLFGNADLTLSLFCLGQTLLYAWILADILSLLAARGVPRAPIIIAAALYAALPVFPAYAFCMGKDSSFALCMLFFGRAGLGILTNRREPLRSWITLIISGLLMSLCRNGAFLLALIPLVIYFVQFPRKRILLSGAAAAILFFQFGIPPMIGAPKEEAKENLSIPLQQVARIAVTQWAGFSREDKAPFKEFLTIGQWRKYKPGISDPIKKRFLPEEADEAAAEDASADSDAAERESGFSSMEEQASAGDSARNEEEEIRKFLSLWGSQIAKYPGIALEAAALMNYTYLVPQAARDDLKPRLFPGMRNFAYVQVEELCTLTKNENPGVEKLQATLDFWDNLPGFRMLVRIGLYSWVFIAAGIYCVSRKERRGFIAVLLPGLLTLIGCCFSPVNGYYRYAFPFIVCVPALCSGAFWLRLPRKNRRRR